MPTGADPVEANGHVIRRERPSDPTTRVRYRCDNCGETARSPSGFYHFSCREGDDR